MKSTLFKKLLAAAEPVVKSDARFKTTDEWAVEWECDRVTANRALRRGMQARPPIVEMKLVPRRTICGYMRLAPHYAEIK
jgi:hypothetical protein